MNEKENSGGLDSLEGLDISMGLQNRKVNKIEITENMGRRHTTNYHRKKHDSLNENTGEFGNLLGHSADAGRYME